MQKSRIIIGLCVVVAVMGVAWVYLRSQPEVADPTPPTQTMLVATTEVAESAQSEPQVVAAEPALVGAMPVPRILLPIVEDGKWGVMDATGKVVLEPQFDAIQLMGPMRDDEHGIPMQPVVAAGVHALAETQGLTVHDIPMPAIQAVLGVNVVGKMRSMPDVPYVADESKLVVTLLDSELKVRGDWTCPVPDAGFTLAAPFANPITRYYPAIPVDGQMALVRPDGIVMTPILDTPDIRDLRFFQNGYVMLTRERTSVLFAPDGTLIYTATGEQHIVDRYGSAFVFLDPASETYTLVDGRGQVVISGAEQMDRVSDEVVFSYGHTDPICLIHAPSKRRVELTADGKNNDLLTHYDYAATDRRIAVLRWGTITLYDLQLNELQVLDGNVRTGDGTLQSEQSRFIIGDTIVDEDGQRATVKDPKWFEEEGLMFIRDGRIWRLGPDMQPAPWGIDVTEISLPGTPAPKVLATHEGVPLCKPYGQDVQAYQYFPPEVTGYGEPVVILMPIGDDAAERRFLIQIGDVRYPTNVKGPASITKDPDPQVTGFIYHRGKRFNVTAQGIVPTITEFALFESVGQSALLKMTFDWGPEGSLAVDRFNLVERQWLTEAEVYPDSYLICPGVHIFHVPDSSWGYRHISGKTLWHSAPDQ